MAVWRIERRLYDAQGLLRGTERRQGFFGFAWRCFRVGTVDTFMTLRMIAERGFLNLKQHERLEWDT